jgi:hypothetical protein
VEGQLGASGPDDRIQRQQTGDGRDPRVDPLAPPRSFPVHRRLPDSVGTGLSDDTNLANEDGTRDTIPAVMRAVRVKAERDEELKEASGGIPDGALPTPALKRRRGNTSTLRGRPILIGGGARPHSTRL